MWGRKRILAEESEASPLRLRQALRQARIEAAERTGIVVDLHDAEVARLELLNEALDPLFADVPEGVELFDRGVSRGDAPRLWIDAVAHVLMARDKRTYRFVQDTRFGRKVLAESTAPAEIVEAVTAYVARRMIERERALAGDERTGEERWNGAPSRRKWMRLVGAFAFGLLMGLLALFAAAWVIASGMPG